MTINSIVQNIGKNKISYLYSGIFAVALILIASLVNRSIHNDDAWLGEQAYWLVKVGRVKSELLRGLNNYEVQQFVYHKLFIWVGASFITLFGFKLYVLKSISLVFLVIFLSVFYRFTFRTLGLEKSIVLTLLLIILLNPLVFNYAFIYRPEIMLMSTGFITYIFLYLAHHEDQKKYALLAGLFGGLSFLTHLNGISIVVTGFISLIVFRHYKLSVFYALAAFITASLYFVDLHSLQDFRSFIYQFNNDPAITDNDYSGLVEYVSNFLSEHKRFFRGPKTLLLSLLVLFSLLLGYKGLKKESFLIVFTLVLIFVFATLAQSKTNRYMLIYMPYLWLIIGFCLQYITTVSSNRKKYLLYTVFGLYSLFNVGLNISSLSDNENEVKNHQQISEKYGLRDQKMVGPMSFIYEQIEYQDIHSVRVYLFLKERGKFRNDGNFDFFKTAEFFGNKAIVMIPVSYDLMNIPVPTQSDIGRVFGKFVLKEIISDQYYIYVLNH